MKNNAEINYEAFNAPKIVSCFFKDTYFIPRDDDSKITNTYQLFSSEQINGQAETDMLSNVMKIDQENISSNPHFISIKE